MLRAGWDAHKLNAPGIPCLVTRARFPNRARSYGVKDQAITDTAARYAAGRPELDKISRQALTPSDDLPRANADYDQSGILSDDNPHPGRDDALWLAMLQAPGDGTDIGELMRTTGWKRTKPCRHLREHAQAGSAIQVGREALTYADHRGAVTVSDRPVPTRRARVCT
jgi:hypothetical protein